MSKLTSREVRLASRPEGVPAATNFTLVRTELEPLQDREVLVRNLFMSVDPYMRGRMNEGQSYVPPFELGKPLDGGAVGEVVESRANEFRVGDAVTSSRGRRGTEEAPGVKPAPLSVTIHYTATLNLIPSFGA